MSLSLVQAYFDANNVPWTWYDKGECLHYIHQPGWVGWEVGAEVYCDTPVYLRGSVHPGAVISSSDCKWVPHTSSEKDAMSMLCYIEKYIKFE